MQPSLVVHNARLWSPGGVSDHATALAVSDGLISVIGPGADILPLASGKTRVLDAQGGMLLPGFCDSHLHILSGGLSLLRANLRKAACLADVRRLLAEYARRLPPDAWIQGGYWDHEAWQHPVLPTRWDIDDVCQGRPALLRRIDGHIALVNSCALERAGISHETPDPPGGSIRRDDNGEPTGILIDRAIEPVACMIPRPGPDQQRSGIREALRLAASLGITAVRDMGTQAGCSVLREFAEAGELTLHCRKALRWGETFEPGSFGPLEMGMRKLFSDGSFGAQSALLFEPYADRPDTCGVAVLSREELFEQIPALDRIGEQIVVHAIGDQAVRNCLDAFEYAIAKNPTRPRRHCIEHAQMLHPDDLPRFAGLGIIASLQPGHAVDDMRFLPKRLGTRVDRAHPCASLLEAGAEVCFGSDWPVVALDPIRDIHAAVTRCDRQGWPEGGWKPEERVDLDAVLKACTLGGAYASMREDQCGRLHEGLRADLVLLDADLRQIRPEDWLSVGVRATIFGGDVVYETD